MRYLAAGLSVASLFLLIACGSKSTPTTTPSSAATTALASSAPEQAATSAAATSTPAAAVTTAAATASATAPSLGDLCVPKGRDLAPCVDKQAKLVGTKPKHVEQHPIAAVPFPDANGKKWTDEVFEIDGRQIVVVVEKRSSCPGEVEIIGALRAVSGGGAPGTKNSYEGFVVDRATLRCL